MPLIFRFEEQECYLSKVTLVVRNRGKNGVQTSCLPLDLGSITTPNLFSYSVLFSPEAPNNPCCKHKTDNSSSRKLPSLSLGRSISFCLAFSRTIGQHCPITVGG